MIQGDAVHTINNWEELKQRLGPKRRCYGISRSNMRIVTIGVGYFHPNMPDEVLIFIQVAIADEISHDVQVILGEKYDGAQELTGNCAIFYSISATQKGAMVS